MRTRCWIAALLVGASSVVVALAWPAPRYSGPPAPAVESEQLALYRESLDQQWDGWVRSMYPDAERPEVDAIELLPTRERDLAVGRCLEEFGFTVTNYGSGVGSEPPGDGDPEAASIGEFACQARYPYEGQLDYLMTVEQRSALYDYYTGYLPSCLAFTGVAVTSTAPSRQEFIETSVQWPIWTPYEAVWESGPTEEEYAASERRCPSEPAWRRQVNVLSTVDG